METKAWYSKSPVADLPVRSSYKIHCCSSLITLPVIAVFDEKKYVSA